MINDTKRLKIQKQIVREKYESSTTKIRNKNKRKIIIVIEYLHLHLKNKNIQNKSNNISFVEKLITLTVYIAIYNKVHL